MVSPSSGWIEVICGPMFSGKSEELIRRLRRCEIAKCRVLVFKPALDTRYSEDEIVTHCNARIAATPVESAREIFALAGTESHVIGIDEAHFFGHELVSVADQLAYAGKRVIVAGLDTDFRGRPFPPIPELLAIAESITKFLAICVRCGAPAKHSQRLSRSRDLILVGAADVYEPRCRRCFNADAGEEELLQVTSVPREQTPLVD